MLSNYFSRIEQAKMIERFGVARAICLRFSSNELVIFNELPALEGESGICRAVNE
jgi:hypothetical protein